MANAFHKIKHSFLFQTLEKIKFAKKANHSSTTRKHCKIVNKLEMANAFNKVGYNFLLQTLEMFKFAKEWIIQWIKACIVEPWIMPLISDQPIHFFVALRGIKQGWPLSPYLYILMLATFGKSVELARWQGIHLRIKIVWGSKSMNHFHFPNNTLFWRGI